VVGARNNALVRVSDVGRVELGAETYSANLRFGGLNAAGVGIQLLPSANAIDTLRGVMAELERVSDGYLLLSVPNQPFFALANFLRGKNSRYIVTGSQSANQNNG